MEVGAVKQAFNNEIILLKKKLNQAKLQIIHKLTRKAKTFIEKKVPEKLKVKYAKKAESAVKEVLIIKKIKAKEVAKFIVTHKGELNGYLNRPSVDQDKACARLLLHKVLQDKYKCIRERYSNISIKDLFMSRQERIKLKKEARETQKNKKHGKNINKPVQAEGEWDVEDIDVKNSDSDNDSKSSADTHDQVNDNNEDAVNNHSVNNKTSKPSISLKNNTSNRDIDNCSRGSSESNGELESDGEVEFSKSSNVVKPSYGSNDSDDSSEDESTGKFAKYTACMSESRMFVNNNNAQQRTPAINGSCHKTQENNNQGDKKHKDKNKNKNLKNKILLKNFNKEKLEMSVHENKVADPFFITSTGETYMSIAELRPPDEVKEVHKQGNRKYRRAVMFGIVPKAKPRRHDRPDTVNSSLDNFCDNKSSFRRGNFKPDNFGKYGAQKTFENNDRNDTKENVVSKSKPDKLHPSWEAKKRQSGILPFQGKKIVFDES